MTFWFTSDLHLGHSRIIEYCNRPFKSVWHMNEEIIRRWNERVKFDDQVFHIGDFCFRGGIQGDRVPANEWESKLNGKIIHVRGNHDRNNSCKTIINGLLIEYGHQKAYLVHDPEHYNSNYDLNFVGHVHEKWQYKKIQHNPYFKNKFIYLINVGTDVNNFMPKTFDEIIKGFNIWRKNNERNN